MASYDKPKVRQILDSVKAAGRTSLTAPEGKQVCDAYGIAVPQEGVATSAAQAQQLASSMGFPVVMKIVSPDILHKTEAGGVMVGVKSAQEAEAAFNDIMKKARTYNKKAKLEGVLVEEMVTDAEQVIVGFKQDRLFGPAIT